MPISTGDAVLDDALDGGIPENAAVLLTGGPGTGKTTAGMQFLQAGLENDERCLFISTEQATTDLRSALDGFAFDLDHPNLLLTTVHAGTGESVTNNESGLVLRTLDGGATVDEGRSVPFTPQYIKQYFDRFAPVDRVVLDSASGLAALTDDHARYRRVILDIIRQFKQTFDATAMLTAQDFAAEDDTAATSSTVASSLALQFTLDGVMRLWQDEVEGEYLRYLHVTKMRGVDHDRRPFQMSFDADGFHLTPANRSPPASLSAKGRLSTSLSELDTLLGGGLVTGGTVSYLSSPDAHPELVLSKLVAAAREADREVILVPKPNQTFDQLQRYLSALGGVSLRDELDAESIRVLDVLAGGSQSTGFFPDGDTSPGVSTPKQDELIKVIQQAHYKSSEPVMVLLSCQSVRMCEEEITLSQFISTFTAAVRGTNDTMVFYGTRNLVEERPRAALVNASDQVLRHSKWPNGMEHVRLQKGLGGEVGSSRIVEYYRESPYLSLS